MISEDIDIANVFNKYGDYVNVASKIKEHVENPEFDNIKGYVDSKVPEDIFFNNPDTTCSFVRDFLVNLNATKATGLDCIGPRLLKLAPDILCPSITYIVNKSLISGIFP